MSFSFSLSVFSKASLGARPEGLLKASRLPSHYHICIFVSGLCHSFVNLLFDPANCFKLFHVVPTFTLMHVPLCLAGLPTARGSIASHAEYASGLLTIELLKSSQQLLWVSFHSKRQQTKWLRLQRVKVESKCQCNTGQK